jgi:hypothetical protein
MGKIEAGTYDCAGGSGNVEISEDDLSSPEAMRNKFVEASVIYGHKCPKLNCPKDCGIKHLISELMLSQT